MALTFTFCGSGGSTTGATSYTVDTNTATPSANSLLVAVVINSLASSPLIPTSVTGHGQTYANVSVTGTLSTTHQMSVWVAKATSPTATAVTADFNGVTQTGCLIHEFGITGADLSGTAAAAIVQIQTATGTATNATSTNLLNAAGASGNLAMAFWGRLYNEAAASVGGNWAEVTNADTNYNTPRTALESQVTATTYDRSPGATWTNSVVYRCIAIEVKADPSKSVSLTQLSTGAAEQTMPSVAHTQALTGQAGTSEAGTITPDKAWVSALTGQGVAISKGDLSAGGRDKSLTGLEATIQVVEDFAPQPLKAALSKALSGQEATSALGTITPTVAAASVYARVTWTELEFPYAAPTADVSVSLTGLEAVVEQGLLLVQHSQSLAGLAGTSEQGSLGVSHSQNLSGNEATVSEGVFAPTSVRPLTGQEGVLTQGTLRPDHSNALSGQEATGAQGSLGNAHQIPLVGQQITAEQGVITPLRDADVAVNLSGLEVTVSQGDLQSSIDRLLEGSEIVVSHGTLTALGPEVLPAAALAELYGGAALRKKYPKLTLAEKVEVIAVVSEEGKEQIRKALPKSVRESLPELDLVPIEELIAKVEASSNRVKQQIETLYERAMEEDDEIALLLL